MKKAETKLLNKMMDTIIYLMERQDGLIDYNETVYPPDYIPEEEREEWEEEFDRLMHFTNISRDSIN